MIHTSSPAQRSTNLRRKVIALSQLVRDDFFLFNNSKTLGTVFLTGGQVTVLMRHLQYRLELSLSYERKRYRLVSSQQSTNQRHQAHLRSWIHTWAGCTCVIQNTRGAAQKSVWWVSSASSIALTMASTSSGELLMFASRSALKLSRPFRTCCHQVQKDSWCLSCQRLDQRLCRGTNGTIGVKAHFPIMLVAFQTTSKVFWSKLFTGIQSTQGMLSRRLLSWSLQVPENGGDMVGQQLPGFFVRATLCISRQCKSHQGTL
jgi:hypothetical protein